MSAIVSDRRAEIVFDVYDARFSREDVHHGIEAFDRDGVKIERFPFTPESELGWVDAAFGGWYSGVLAAGGAYVVRDRAGPLAIAGFGAPTDARTQAERPHVARAGPLLLTPAARTVPGLASLLVRGVGFSLRERGYGAAVLAVENDEAPRYAELAGGRIAAADHMPRALRPCRTTILASGAGSNFEAVALAAHAGALPLHVTALVCDRPGAGVLARAARLGVAAGVSAWARGAESRATFDARIAELVARTEPELVLLLGWMHLLPAAFLARFPEVVNLHPAFLPLDPRADVATAPDGTSLPAYRGAHAVDDAIAAGSRWIGATVHRVELAVDRGAVLARRPLAIEPGEPRAEIDRRLHELERRTTEVALVRRLREVPP